MNLLRARIFGFGKLVDLDLRFGRGLNVVFAPNEAGKSTLQQFLVGLLYGPLRSEVKSQRRMEPWAERFKPWRSSEYGGILWCELSDGAEVEIHRTFDRSNRLEIRAATGEDLTRRYTQQKNSDVLFARTVLGMPKELFESVSVIRESRVAEIDGAGSIRERIANLAATGDEEQSVEASLRRLEEALDALGSDRAPTRPYRQAQDRLAALRAERRALDARKAEFAAWVEELRGKADEIQLLEQELERARRRMRAAERRDTERTVQRLDELESEIHGTNVELRACAAALDFPVQNLEELNRLAGSKATLRERLAEARRTLASAVELHDRAREARNELAPYAACDPDGEPRRITEALVRFSEHSSRRSAGAAEHARAAAEAAALARAFEELPAVLRDPGRDWEAIVREAGERQRAAADACLTLSAELLKQSRLAAELSQRRTRWRTAAALLLLVALAAGAGALLGLHSTLAFAAAAAGVAGVAGLERFIRARAAARHVEERIHGIESEAARCRAESAEEPEDLRRARAACGSRTPEQLLDAARGAAELRRRGEEAAARAAAVTADLDRLEREAAQHYAALERSLAAVGLRPDPSRIEESVEAFRRSLHRFRQLEMDETERAREVDALRREEASLVTELADVDSRIGELLRHAGVDSPESFREACRARERAVALDERRRSLQRELSSLQRDLTLEAWKARLAALQAGPPAAETGEVDLEAAQLEERATSARLSAAVEQQARLDERIRRAFENFRTLSEIEEDEAEAAARLDRVSRERSAVARAHEILGELWRDEQRVLAPQLNRAVERRFIRLCAAGYSEVKVDPDFCIWVREGDTDVLRSAGDLSRGTRDQLYLALRFGILDLVSEGFDPSPCLLDEPFAAYDRARLAAAFGVVREEAERRQIILFTCREDVHDLALENGAWAVELPVAGVAARPDGSPT